MIISRTPLRISLAGGGSDIPEYYKNNKLGKVISIGINRYLYVIIKNKLILQIINLKFVGVSMSSVITLMKLNIQ